jgi:hypothetical protein
MKNAILFSFLLILGSPNFGYSKSPLPKIKAVSVVCNTPAITSLSPATVAVGSSATTITINGFVFEPPFTVSETVVYFNNIARPSNYINANTMTFTLSAAELATAGTFPVYVENDFGSGILSNTVTFTVGSCVNSTAMTSTSWTSPSTWSCGAVPTVTGNITIPTGVNVVLNTNAIVNNLTLAGTGKLTLQTPYDLKVNGTLTSNGNQGYIVTQGGTLTLNLTANVAKTFPIGTANNRYDPCTITSNLTQTVKAKVAHVLNAGGFGNAQQVIFNNWDITPASSATISTLSFSPDPATVIADLAAGTPNVPLNPGAIGHFISSARTYYYDEYRAVYSNGQWTVANYNGGYSPFSVGNVGAFNPVTLSIALKNLAISRKNGVNTLNWTTEQEKNNASFAIQRATDGQHFSEIGAVKGVGTSTQNHDYSFEDKNALVGVNYYRLQSTDDDGTAAYSKTVAIESEKTAIFRVFPSLVSDKLTIVSDSKTAESFDIINLMSQIVLSGICEAQKEITVSNLPSGTYIFKMGEKAVKFIKY